MFYSIVLTLHNIVRWLIVLSAVLAIVRAFTGLSFKRGYTLQDKNVGLWFTIFLDIQVLLGIVLYFFLSPKTIGVLQDFSQAMGNSLTRFYAVEHIFLMVLAVVIAHMGRSFIRKANAAPEKHRRTLLWFGLAILLILAAIPWNFSPLLRFGV